MWLMEVLNHGASDVACTICSLKCYELFTWLIYKKKKCKNVKKPRLSHLSNLVNGKVEGDLDDEAAAWGSLP